MCEFVDFCLEDWYSNERRIKYRYANNPASRRRRLFTPARETIYIVGSFGEWLSNGSKGTHAPGLCAFCLGDSPHEIIWFFRALFAPAKYLSIGFKTCERTLSSLGNMCRLFCLRRDLPHSQTPSSIPTQITPLHHHYDQIHYTFST